jgi:hypothetical protein
MKAIWIGIYDRGVLKDERVHYRVNVDLDLAYFAVFDTASADANTISAGHSTCYWFGPTRIKAGENVVLYTRAGSYSTETRKDGTVYHFFFRGRGTALYQNADSRAVLFELNTWATAK